MKTNRTLRTRYEVSGTRSSRSVLGTDLRASLIWSVLGLMLSNVSCNESALEQMEPRSMDRELAVQNDDGMLRVEALDHSKDKLQFTYGFRNGADRNAYLFNLAYTEVTEDGIFQVDPTVVNIQIEDERIVVSQKIVPVPPFTLVEQPVLPCVTKVKPGETFERTIRLELPLTPQGPYMEPVEEPVPDRVEQRSLSFELGYFIVGEGGDHLAEEVETSLGPRLRFEPFPEESQRTLRVDEIADHLPVKVAR